MTTAYRHSYHHVYPKRQNVVFFYRVDRSRYADVIIFAIIYANKSTAKLEDVTRLIDKLTLDLQHVELLPHRKLI